MTDNKHPTTARPLVARRYATYLLRDLYNIPLFSLLPPLKSAQTYVRIQHFIQIASLLLPGQDLLLGIEKEVLWAHTPLKALKSEV